MNKILLNDQLNIITKTEVAAVILVGGKSSRMGSNKAQLLLHGQKLIDVVASVIKNAGILSLYVSGSIHDYCCIPDIIPHYGPVGGLCSSIIKLTGSYLYVIFIPVDMPLINKKVITTLVQHETLSPVCYFAHNPLPCLIQLNNTVKSYAIQVVQSMTAGDMFSVKKFLMGLPSTSIIASKSLIENLINTNTPQEWQKAIYAYTYK